LFTYSRFSFLNRLQGQDSHWFGYLRSLPEETVDLALFWGVSDEILAAQSDHDEPLGVENDFPGSLRFRDGQEAATWLTGTELEKEIQRSAETDETLLVSHD
jgi:hypothetical protein